MNNDMNDKLFELYTLAELKYKRHFDNVNDNILFPSGWYGNKNYQKKIEIICEAIKTNTLIVNTKSYLDITEGVKYNFPLILFSFHIFIYFII